MEFKNAERAGSAAGSPEEINPYAAPTDFPLASPDKPKSWYQRQSFLNRSIICWTTVCTLSAAPSFFWGFGTIAGEQILAMLLGIATFIAVYVATDVQTQQSRVRKNRSVSITLSTVYCIRIGMTIIFPVALYLDLFAGMFSVAAYEFVFGKLQNTVNSPSRMGVGSFIDVYIITLLQGVVLNLILLVIAAPILLTVTLARANRARD